MIDINTYRSRKGLFSPSNPRNKSVFRHDYSHLFWWKRNTSGKKVFSGFQAACKLILIMGLVYPPGAHHHAIVQAVQSHHDGSELELKNNKT